MLSALIRLLTGKTIIKGIPSVVVPDPNKPTEPGNSKMKVGESVIAVLKTPRWSR